MDFHSRIRDSFARQNMMATLGAQIDSIAKGQVSISAPILPATSQQHGYAHAALAFAIGDSAAGYSALTLMAEDKEVVTSEMGIHLLAPATGDRLIANGSVIRSGRRQCVVQAQVIAVCGADQTLCAILTGTMVAVPA